MGNWVTTDAVGNVYLTGDYNGGVISIGSLTLPYAGAEDAFISKFDSSGNVIWAKGIGNSGNDKGYCIVTDKCNNIYLSGGSCCPLSPSLVFDTITLQLAGGDPLFIVKYDSSGHALFAKSASSGGDDQNAIALTRSGNLYIGGDFWGSSFIIGNDTLIDGGGEDFFVAKLNHVSDLNCSTILTAFFQSSDTNICAEGNNCINFTDLSSGNPTSWQWSFPGATPSSSTLQNPDSICYLTPGTYPVTLIVTNASGSDTLTVSPMIIAGASPPPPVLVLIGGDTVVSSHASHYQWYYDGVLIPGATDSFYVVTLCGFYSVMITDSNGCATISNAIGNPCAVFELNGGDDISVYPNPAVSQLVVRREEFIVKNSQLEIYNVFGERSLPLHLWNGPGSTSVDISELRNGVYFLKVKSGERTVNKKFVVLH